MSGHNGQESRKDIENALDILRANKEVLESGQKEISYMLYQRYSSLMEAGFTSEQAFEIIKHRGVL